MDTLIRSISGLRGIAGASFNNQILKTHINAFLSSQKIGTILVASDGRPHGKKYLKICNNTIIKAGFNVIDCGIIPTPTAQFLVQDKQYSGGIIITASHNPSEWNGLKFLDEGGCFLNPKKMKKLLELADINKMFKKVNVGKIKINNNLWIEHLNHTLNLSCIDIESIKLKKLKVVVDAVNSAGSKIIPRLLDKLNCEVIKINCNGNGQFTRGPEPLPKNLNSLCKTVVSEKADFGLATDPDADRLAIVDELGMPLGEEFTLAIAIDGFLNTTQKKNPVVVNLSTSMLSEYACIKNGVDLIRTKVGEINVVEEMKIKNSEIGGEGNGGVILKASHLGRDSLVATALVINQFVKLDLPVSHIRNKFPNYNLIKDKINIKGLNLNKIINNLKTKFNDAIIDERDGLKLIWDKKWIHIRESNTELILRIYAEAENISEIENYIKKIKIFIENSIL